MINFVQISVDFFLNNLIDCIIGEAILIGEQDFIISLLNLRKFGGHEFQKNWQIAFKMDFNYEVKIINKKHLKYKQIVKMINILVEHGIKKRAERLHEYGIFMLFDLFVRLSNLKVVNQIKFELNKKREQITLNELSNVFAISLAAFSFLFVVFIIEFIYFKFENNLSLL